MLGSVSLLCVPVAAHAARITLAWDASTSTVSGYRIYYGTSSGNYTNSVDVGNQTSYALDGLTNGVRYYFVVRAYTAAGVLSANSNEVNGLAVASPFTDTLLSGATTIRAIHIAEMRSRINALRAATPGLAPISWTDPVLTAGATTIKTVHITQLRTALNQVYAARKLAPPSYTTDPNLTAGSTPIRAAHINELRNAIMQVE